jgi:hypothetical protein
MLGAWVIVRYKLFGVYMRAAHLSSPVTISPAVILTALQDARRTARTLTLPDSRCLGLRLLVRPRLNPLWQVVCYGKSGRLEQLSLGVYPSVGTEEARRRARQIKLQVKGIVKMRSRRVSLFDLFQMYEQESLAHPSWPKLTDTVYFCLKPFVFRSWVHINRRTLQGYVDGYPAYKNMMMAVWAVNKVVVWAEDAGLIEQGTRIMPTTSSSIRRNARHRRKVIT